MFSPEELVSSSFVSTELSAPITEDSPATFPFVHQGGNLLEIKLQVSLPQANGGDFFDQYFYASLTDAQGEELEFWVVELTDKIIQEENVILSLMEKTTSSLTGGQSYLLTLSTDEMDPFKAPSLQVGTSKNSPIASWALAGENQPALPGIIFKVQQPIINLELLLPLIILLIAILFALFLPKIPSNKIRVIYQILLWVFLLFSNLWLVEKLASNKEILSFYAVLWNMIIFMVFYFLFLFISNRFWLANILGTFLILAGGLANHYLLLFRNTTLLPQDFYGISTAIEVAGNYAFTLSYYLLFALLFFIFVVFAAFRQREKVLQRKEKAHWRKRLISLALFGAFSFLLWSNIEDPNRYSKTSVGKLDQWSQNGAARRSGLYLNFAVNIPSMLSTKPANYQPEKFVNKLSPPMVKDFAPISNSLPNVVLILNESLADFSFLGDPGLTKDYLPYIHSLSQQENTYYGRAVVPVFGGLTSTSEFELLTGFSMGLQNTSYAPFATYIHRNNPLPSLASYFVSLGYEKTIALHPQNGRNWDRDTSWPLLGFTYSYFEEDLPHIQRLRGFPDDHSLYENIIDIMAEGPTEPHFVYALTMQNHGGYEVEGFESTIHFKDSHKSELYPSVEQYATLANISDQAFQELISYFSTIDYPTLVIMLGDHFPGLSGDYLDEIRQNDHPHFLNQTSVSFYQTPVIMWSNYDLTFETVPDYFSLNYLGSLIKEAAALPLTSFDLFSLELLKSYPIISKQGHFNNEGKQFTTEEIIENPLINLYEQIIYNNILDLKNTNWELFSLE